MAGGRKVVAALLLTAAGPHGCREVDHGNGGDVAEIDGDTMSVFLRALGGRFDDGTRPWLGRVRVGNIGDLHPETKDAQA